MKKYLYILSLALAELVFSPTVLSMVVYEQPWGGAVRGPFSQTQGNIPSNTQEIADNFTAQDNWVLTGINWFGTYSTAPLPANQKISFLIRLYEDEAGLPSASPFYEQSVIPSYSETVSTSSLFGYEITANLAIPAALQGGSKYWIAILDDDNATPNYIWNGNVLGVGDGYAFRQGDAWARTTTSLWGTTDRAFSLTTVPIPHALFLFITGLSFLLLTARRRSAAS